MSREAGLAAVRQRRWGEASELLGELAASGQADAAALDKQRRDGYASMAKSFMTTALRLRGAQRRCDLSDLRHVYAQVVVLGRDARRKRRRARVNRADSRSSKAVSRPEGSIADSIPTAR
jgi:hypothetical protein